MGQLLGLDSDCGPPVGDHAPQSLYRTVYGGVVGVFNDPFGLLPVPLCVEDGSTVLVMFCAIFTTFCRAFRFREVPVLYQTVVQPVSILSMVHLLKLQSVLEAMLSLRRKTAVFVMVSMRSGPR